LFDAELLAAKTYRWQQLLAKPRQFALGGKRIAMAGDD
jgi:hypothetical protein